MSGTEPVEFARTGTKKHEKRPWGSTQAISSGPGFVVVRISVSPGAVLPLHWHRHRDELWSVARGTGRIGLDGVSKTVGRGQAVNIPRTVPHGIENISSIDPLELIEVQTGEYAGDDDVVWA